MASSRARFQAELEQAAGKDIPNVQDICRQDDRFIFAFHHPHLSPPHYVEITVSLQDDTFLVFTDADVPPSMAKELEDTMQVAYGLKIPVMLDNLSRRLRTAVEGAHEVVGNVAEDENEDEDSDIAMIDIDDQDLDGSEQDDDNSSDGSFEYGDNDLFGEDDTTTACPSLSPSTLRQIQQDFREVRQAGFKVGILGGFSQHRDQSIVSISIRTNKLCLSDETLEAWGLNPSDFVVLMIRYGENYTTLDDALFQSNAASNLEFCLRRCSAYKPTLQQALAEFSTLTQPHRAGPDPLGPKGTGSADPQLSLLSIGKSIDRFMNKDFVPMLKLRIRHEISWDDAKSFLSELQKSVTYGSSQDPPVPPPSEHNIVTSDLPGFLAKGEGNHQDPDCLPLRAMQFAMRYLVRCVDYCMVCHQRVGGKFEFLKPYVCGNPLCLFQYMNLGFGPNVEYEILKQPQVVDLLTSFCYASLGVRPDGRLRIREFPTGLSLSVPNIHQKAAHFTEMGAPTFINPREVHFDPLKSCLTTEPNMNINDPREGQWVAIILPPQDRASQNPPAKDDKTVLIYARIKKVEYVKITLDPASLRILSGSMPYGFSNRDVHAQMILFDQNLDDLEDRDKAFAMNKLLLALPSVAEMREYVVANPGRPLSKWDKMVPSSLALLRWIVASNRSYIRQIDECTDNEHGGDANALSRKNEKIQGVHGWTQFRFAQSSPEKEALFQEVVEQVSKPQRTILAWHGSSLGNWHSIIRQGLDYKESENGRAYGDGVYFSRTFETSQSYSHFHPGSLWPNSDLKIQSAVSLAELVNSPQEFASTSPHFVVQHCHWIQCRYLFVRALNIPNTMSPSRDALIDQEEFVQDPEWKATGPVNMALFIPKLAISSASRNETELTNLPKHDTEGHSGDTGDEDEGDIEFLMSSDDAAPSAGSKDNRPPAPGPVAPMDPKTDFHPGTLDLNSLPLLKPPSYATGPA